MSGIAMRVGAIVALLLFLVACQAPAATPTVAPTLASAPSATKATPPVVDASRVEVLNLANAAFARGDLTTASGLFERVVNTPPSDEPPAAATAVTAFAHFRALVTYLAAGREDEARAHLDALQQTDSSAPLAKLAAQLWDQYGMVGQLSGACAQIQPQIASEAGPTLAALKSAGVKVDAETLCRA